MQLHVLYEYNTQVPGCFYVLLFQHRCSEGFERSHTSSQTFCSQGGPAKQAIPNFSVQSGISMEILFSFSFLSNFRSYKVSFNLSPSKERHFLVV